MKPQEVRSAYVAAARKAIVGMLHEAIKPHLLGMVKALRARQPPYWHRDKWWIR